MLLNPINSATPQIVEFALDGLALRHQAIATNIANIDTVGYRPMNVSFERQILGMLNNQTPNNMAQTSFKQTPVVTYGKKQESSSNNTGIDMNTVLMNQNVIQYQALIKGLDHYISTLSIAVKEGRN